MKILYEGTIVEPLGRWEGGPKEIPVVKIRFGWWIFTKEEWFERRKVKVSDWATPQTRWCNLKGEPNRRVDKFMFSRKRKEEYKIEQAKIEKRRKKLESLLEEQDRLDHAEEQMFEDIHFQDEPISYREPAKKVG